jgi:ABC-2 type transport system permease protein
VFLSLGISDPLVNFYMDDIMASVGNMPEGFEFSLPEFQPVDLLVASTGQFQSIGLVVLVAIFASSISRERQNGTAVFLYARPLNFTAYFFSKYVVALCISILCAVLGYGGSVYYTTILYGHIDLMHALYMTAGYCLWLLFVLAFTLCMSAMFKTAVSMFVSLIVFVAGSLIDSIIGSFWSYSPFKLATYSVEFVGSGVSHEHFWQTALLTMVLTIICVILGIVMSKRNMKKLVL